MYSQFKQGIIYSLLASILSAGFTIPWKLASEIESPQNMVFMLLLTSSVMTLVGPLLVRKRKKDLKIPSRREVMISFLLGALTILGNQFFAMSINVMSPAIVTTILRSEVIFVSILAWIILKEPVSWNFFLGVIVLILGIWAMNPTFDFEDDFFKGSILSISAAISFSFMGIITRKFIHTIDLSRVNSLRLWFSLIILVAIYGKSLSLDTISIKFVSLIIIAAWLGPIMGRYFLMKSMKYVNAQTASLVVSSAPVWALFLGWAVLQDLPSNQEILGGSIMMIGVTISLSDTFKLRD